DFWQQESCDLNPNVEWLLSAHFGGLQKVFVAIEVAEEFLRQEVLQLLNPIAEHIVFTAGSSRRRIVAWKCRAHVFAQNHRLVLKTFNFCIRNVASSKTINVGMRVRIHYVFYVIDVFQTKSMAGLMGDCRTDNVDGVRGIVIQ